nr:AT-rich interactive domain-containing protein 3A [Anolis sagrei ordinatus]
MKLQAVMENLQRQQQARLQQEMEARQQQAMAAATATSTEDPPRGRMDTAEPESARMQRAQMEALAAMRAAAAGLGHSPLAEGGGRSSSLSSETEGREEGEDEETEYPPGMGSEEEEAMLKGRWGDEDDFEDEEEEEEEEEDYDEEEEGEEMPEEGLGDLPGGPVRSGPVLLRKQPAPQPFRGEPSPRTAGLSSERLPSGAAPQALAQPQPPVLDHGDWTYEEQFKQLYELDADPKRKEFLDDLFSFMQKRGTPVNRIPIMAKQVLDLYMLYVLVTEKGGLVEVINKKLWREITKGLSLPTSITSAAFTLRTQYMKYLYPYECEKRGLSNPNELQAAIDSNRREGRRQGFGGSLFAYSPGGTHSVMASPKIQGMAAATAAATNGSPGTPKIKKEEDSSAVPIALPARLPVSLAGHSAVQAVAAAQVAALEQLREKLESGEPPEKKVALAEEQQRLMQRALQQNLLAMAGQLPMSLRISSSGSSGQGRRSPESRQDTAANLATNGTNSISMSVEINGIVYTGVLFAQTSDAPLGKSGANSGQQPGSGATASSAVPAPAVGAPPAGLPAAPTSTSSNSSSP